MYTIGMRILTKEKRVAVVAALVEGNSIRATVRMTGVAKKTVIKLLVDLGRACLEYQDRTLRGLHCKRIQCDEIWSFCYGKQKNLPENLRYRDGYGDVWTWTAICADSKLVACWHVGNRNPADANAFIQNLAGRMVERIQINTDGLDSYLEAIAVAFNKQVDYSQIVKVYGKPKGKKGSHFTPDEVIAVKRERKIGHPDVKHTSTSFVERQNLTMRMSMRRFTRSTNAFSKKLDNLKWAVALHFMYYNFARIHQTLRCSPAMRAGVTDTLWSIEDIVGLLPK